MSKIIYYIGAGASYGRKETRKILDNGTEKERLIVHDGLPVVNEIAECLQSFRLEVEEASINATETYVFLNNKYERDGSDLIVEKKRLIEDCII